MTDSAVVPAEVMSQEVVVGTEPRSWSMPDLMKFCKTIAPTEFVPKGLRDNPPAILAAMMSGREMGIGPMEALQEVMVVDGWPACSARLMRKLVYRRGHRIDVEEMTPERCVLQGTRSDSGASLTVEWTIFDAMRAGLIGTVEAWESYTDSDGRTRKRKLTWNPVHGEPEPAWVSERGRKVEKDNWRNYPRQMLFARASTELCRALFADCLGSVQYEPSEIGGEVHPADLDAP